MAVYAIAERDSTTGMVKIGTSAIVAPRLRALQTASARPLVLLAQWEGNRHHEARLHCEFAERRQQGEWFDMTDLEPVAAISTVLGREPVPSDETTTPSRRSGPTGLPLPRDVIDALLPYVGSGASLTLTVRTEWADRGPDKYLDTFPGRAVIERHELDVTL